MKILLIIATAASLLSGCATSRQHGQTWEYKTVAGKVIGNDQSLTAAINTQISQGWEFVSAGHAADQWGFAVMRRRN